MQGERVTCAACGGTGKETSRGGVVHECGHCDGWGYTVQPCPLPEGAPKVIGLCGLAGSGKTQAALILAERGYQRLRFADTLKRMLRVLLYAAGEDSQSAARYIDGDQKEQLHHAFGGHSSRYAMQTLGTEWGRKLIGADLWVDITSAQIDRAMEKGQRVVLDDLRFQNEADVIRSFDGGSVWQVKGRAAEISADGEFHVSESLAVQPDLVIDNSGDLERLEAAVLALLLG